MTDAAAHDRPGDPLRHRDERWMRRAIELAERGRGLVEPNPLVGAVVVRDDVAVAEGWHRAFGEAHAEVDALGRVPPGTPLDGATLYVTLEPCHHRGKTPPCTAALLEAGVRRVVVAASDPNPDVTGGGAAALREAGVEVVEGILEADAHLQNAPYRKLVLEKLPYVTAKWAMSLDGRLAARGGDSKWISCDESRKMVHVVRGECDAITVGVGTLLADDPRLTCRTEPRRLARRIVIDSTARTPPTSRLLAEEGAGPAVVAVTEAADGAATDALEAAGALVWRLPPDPDGRVALEPLLSRLAAEGATNVLVEGGPEVLGSFFRGGHVDRVMCFVAPGVIGGDAHPVHGWGVGRAAERRELDPLSVTRAGVDVLIDGRVRRATHGSPPAPAG